MTGGMNEESIINQNNQAMGVVRAEVSFNDVFNCSLTDYIDVV
jgi:hypothetical protein